MIETEFQAFVTACTVNGDASSALYSQIKYYSIHTYSSCRYSKLVFLVFPFSSFSLIGRITTVWLSLLPEWHSNSHFSFIITLFTPKSSTFHHPQRFQTNITYLFVVSTRLPVLLMTLLAFLQTYYSSQRRDVVALGS